MKLIIIYHLAPDMRFYTGWRAFKTILRSAAAGKMTCIAVTKRVSTTEDTEKIEIHKQIKTTIYPWLYGFPFTRE